MVSRSLSVVLRIEDPMDAMYEDIAGISCTNVCIRYIKELKIRGLLAVGAGGKSMPYDRCPAYCTKLAERHSDSSKLPHPSNENAYLLTDHLDSCGQ